MPLGRRYGVFCEQTFDSYEIPAEENIIESLNMAAFFRKSDEVIDAEPMRSGIADVLQPEISEIDDVEQD